MNKRLFVIGSLLLGASAASWYIYSQVKLLDKVTYSVKGLKLKQASFTNGFIIGVNVEIENKGAIDVLIKGYSIDVYGDGKYLANLRSDKEFFIKPFSKSNFSTDVIIKPKTLFTNIGSVIKTASSWNKIFIEFKGKIKIKKGVLPFRLPVKFGYTLQEIKEGFK
jgi:LEA14-like dessication related protein